MRASLCVVLVVLCGVSLGAAQNPRIYITDSKSWEIGGGFGGTDDAFGGSAGGGARPQTAEIIKTFGQRCPQITVNNMRDKADYVVLLDHEGGKGGIFRDNKVAVFNREGDSIISRSTRSLGNAVQDSCRAIQKDWNENAHKYRSALRERQLPGGGTSAGAPLPAAVASETHGRISIASTPAGADIEVDGKFMGSTPSILHLDLGEHVIAVKKSGYRDWQRTMTVTDGEVNVAPELERLQ
jgi:hypothetical protein